MEPGDNLERLLGVDLELRAWAIEVSVAHAERIDVTAIAVSGGNETVPILGSALVILHAHVEPLLGGWVWCECSGNFVGLPQVHSCTACMCEASHIEANTWIAWHSLQRALKWEWTHTGRQVECAHLGICTGHCMHGQGIQSGWSLKHLQEES